MIEYIYEDGDTSLFDGVWKRDGVIYCPYCRFSYDVERVGEKCRSWYDTEEKVIQVVVQHYECRKDGVLILSRCVDCGEISWVHRTFNCIIRDIEKYNGVIDRDIIEKEMVIRKRDAKIEWDESLCKTCKNLDHTNEVQYNYAYGVWVDCISRRDGHKTKRSGSPKKECGDYICMKE